MRLQPSTKRLILLAGLAWLIFATLTLVDSSLGQALASLQGLAKGDLYSLFRIWGSLWPWILFSIALALSSPAINPARLRNQCAFLLLSPALGGGLAEVLKVTLRRERPAELGAYVFRAWSDRPWSSSGLGLPSSHAAVAFGGSMALIVLFPRLRWPALVMAVGCALTRLISGAHYPTDAYLGALVGAVTGLVLARWLRIPVVQLGHDQPGANQP
jgi:membrane-associated phospholipid phosphatase